MPENPPEAVKMRLSKANQKWWDLANDRRQRLIVRKYRKGGKGLTPEEAAEFKMLQKVADAVLDYVTPEILFPRFPTWAEIEKSAKKSLKNPEIRRLLKKALRSQARWKSRRAKMTPEELKADDEAWAARLAEDIAQFKD